MGTALMSAKAKSGQGPAATASGPDIRIRSRRVGEAIIGRGLQACALLSILISLGIVFVLLSESLPFFAEVGFAEFFLGTRWTPLLEPKSFGVLPLIFGTLLVGGIAACLVIPVGTLAAAYLSEYAGHRTRRWLKPSLEVLAGVPTVVYGYFALMLVTPMLRMIVPGTEIFNALSAGLVVGVMVLPTVASLSDDAMRAVPRTLRDAAYGLGATKHEVTLGVVLPGASSGILASYILGISRAIGETMIVSMAAGSTARITADPLESVQTMTGYVVQVSLGDTPAGTTEYQTIFAVGLTLFLMTLVMNLISQRVRLKFKEKYG
jgi:phosphate transport system permease protein